MLRSNFWIIIWLFNQPDAVLCLILQVSLECVLWPCVCPAKAPPLGCRSVAEISLILNYSYSWAYKPMPWGLDNFQPLHVKGERVKHLDNYSGQKLNEQSSRLWGEHTYFYEQPIEVCKHCLPRWLSTFFILCLYADCCSALGSWNSHGGERSSWIKVDPSDTSSLL